LILYSLDGAASSEQWVDAISTAVEQHRRDAATLRKESSKREPLRRPDLLKMRRESLSQIMLGRRGRDKTHRMILRERQTPDNKNGNNGGNGSFLTPRKLPFASPRKRKDKEDVDATVSPSKIQKKGSEVSGSTSTKVKIALLNCMSDQSLEGCF
jgi:hypothetical protein